MGPSALFLTVECRARLREAYPGNSEALTSALRSRKRGSRQAATKAEFSLFGPLALFLTVVPSSRRVKAGSLLPLTSFLLTFNTVSVLRPCTILT